MGGMKGTCGIIGALLVLAAGAALLMLGMGRLDMATAHMTAGGAFVLLGIAKLVHKTNMCPACKDKK